MTQKKPHKIILGIDPGTNILGYGIIECNGNKAVTLTSGIFNMEKLDDHALKLKTIFEKTLALIEEYLPDEVAAEAPFFGKNVQSMLKLGRAQGVAFAAALYKDIPVFEYSPRKIKQSITGSGSASKEQIASILLNQNYITEIPKNLDATDGLAVALCHFFQKNNAPNMSKTKSTVSKKSKGWSAFVSQNPDKIIK